MSALTNRRGRESTGLRKKPVAGCSPTKGEQPTNPTSREGGGGGSTYIPGTYIPHHLTKTRILKLLQLSPTNVERLFLDCIDADFEKITLLKTSMRFTRFAHFSTAHKRAKSNIWHMDDFKQEVVHIFPFQKWFLKILSSAYVGSYAQVLSEFRDNIQNNKTPFEKVWILNNSYRKLHTSARSFCNSRNRLSFSSSKINFPFASLGGRRGRRVERAGLRGLRSGGGRAPGPAPQGHRLLQRISQARPLGAERKKSSVVTRW